VGFVAYAWEFGEGLDVGDILIGQIHRHANNRLSLLS
jgi:hypothetical protein